MSSAKWPIMYSVGRYYTYTYTGFRSGCAVNLRSYFPLPLALHRLSFVRYIFTRQTATPRFSPTMEPRSPRQCSNLGGVWTPWAHLVIPIRILRRKKPMLTWSGRKGNARPLSSKPGKITVIRRGPLDSVLLCVYNTQTASRDWLKGCL